MGRARPAARHAATPNPDRTVTKDLRRLLRRASARRLLRQAEWSTDETLRSELAARAAFLLRSSLRANRTPDDSAMCLRALIDLGRASLIAGHDVDALSAADELEVAAAACDEPETLHIRTFLLGQAATIRGQCVLRSGDTAAAVRHLMDSICDAPATGYPEMRLAKRLAVMGEKEAVRRYLEHHMDRLSLREQRWLKADIARLCGE
jgi:hypothetical protein